jgi:hypothetical protein
VVSNVETISLRNNNGTAGTAGTFEVQTVTANAMTAGQILNVEGQVVYAIANLTAEQVATALQTGTNLANFYTVSAIPTGYAATRLGNVVTYTATTVGDKANFLLTGTAQTGLNQVNVLTVSGAAIATTATFSILVNGVSVTVGSVATANSTSELAANITSAINGFLGKNVATTVGSTVQLNSSSVVTIGALTKSAGDAAVANVLANKSSTLTVATAAGGATETLTFVINGTSITTGQVGGTGSTTNVATTLAAAINTFYGATVATSNAAVVTLNTGLAGTAIGGFTLSAAGAATVNVTNGVVSAGLVAATPSTVSITSGTSAVNANTFEDIINASNFVGSTSFVSNGSTGAVTINNLTTQSVTAKTNAAALTANYASTATTSTLNIADGTSSGAVSLAGTGLTSATVNSTGAANTITSLGLGANVATLTINAATNLTTGTITAAGLKTVTVGGAATSVNVSTIPASVTSFNASGLTAGGLTATLSATASSTVTGGGGNDTITTAATTATGQVVDAGAGTADVLVLASTNDVSTTAKAAQYQNFEVLRLAKAAQGDLSIFGTGITALQLAALTSGNFSGISATQAGNITVRGDQTTALTLTLANATGTSDVVTLDLKNSATTATNVDVAGLSIVGVETLNIKGSTQSATTPVTAVETSAITIAAGGADALTAINITGIANTSFDAGNTARALTLDATASTGRFTATGNFVAASTVRGSTTAINSFTVGATADTGSAYIGGNNNDLFFSTAALLVANGNGDTTLTGGSGSDTLTITGAGDVTITDNNFTNVTGFENLTLESTGVVSLTTGGSFNAAFTSGVVITNATQAAAKAYTLAAGLANSAITFSLTTANAGSGATDDISIVTGSGNDNVTLTATSFIGDADAADLIVSTGAGSDTISVETGILANNLDVAPVINGGAGQDFITTTHTNGTGATSVFFYTMTAGQSTTTASDNITGFRLGLAVALARADVLDFTNAAVNAYTTTAATGVAGLSVAVAANGLVTFSGTNAATASLADRITAVQTVVTANQGDSALFTFSGNSYVFNNDTAGDSLVTLIGVAGTALGGTAATAGLIGIA